MSIFKCKMCGGALEINENQTVCECEYCGSKQTVSIIDDEKIVKLYDRANRFRMANEFDKAATVYEGIIEENDAEAEAYWGLMLCKYGIEYVDDPATGDKIPTCHRSSFDSFMDDADFEMVMSNADSLSRSVYRAQAKQIEEIRKGIIEVSGKEAPYDIFICYKETDDNGDRTLDSVLAQDVYDALTEKGYRVFFSRISLEDKLGTEYEPYIFAALNSAKIMLAFGTSYDYYNAVWVKNEWSRYLKIMAKDKNKYLIPCYKDIDAYDMPKEFAKLQAQDMGKVGAIQDLLRGINKILQPERTNTKTANAQDIQAMVANAVATSSGSNINTLLERGFMTLEDGDFDKADNLFEDVLNQNPKCAEAYMGKLYAYYKVRNTESFAKLIFDRAINNREKRHFGLNQNEVNKSINERDVLSNQLSKEMIDLIHEAFNTKYDTNYFRLHSYDNSKDYIEIFCSLNNTSDTKSEMDDRYYERFKQYASATVLDQYSVNKFVDKLVETTTKKSEEDLRKIENRYSVENLNKILGEADDRVRVIRGDEFEKIEAKYRADLKTWEEHEKAKQDDYEKACKDITENWPRKMEEAQEAWQAECARLSAEYNAKKVEREAEVARVQANNIRIQNDFNQAKAEYENEKNRLDNQIRTLQTEYSSLGIFKKKQKETVLNNISVLETKKNSLVCPNITSFGQMLSVPKEIESLQLPEQPQVIENPILPPRPVEAEKPVKGEGSVEVDVVDILCEVFAEHGISAKRMEEQHEKEKELLRKKKEEEERVQREKKAEEERIRREKREKEEIASKLKQLRIQMQSAAGNKTILNLGDNQNCMANTWMVLATKGKEMLIILEKIIDVRKYHEEFTSITWEKCTLRKYLNDEFYNSFSEQLKAVIKKVKNKNLDNKKYKTVGGEDTEDKVFCLSIDEVYQYFKDDNDRAAYPTDYAKKKTGSEEFIDNQTGGARWWLRSPGDYVEDAAFVDGHGCIHEDGYRVYRNNVGLRPAMWLNLE